MRKKLSELAAIGRDGLRRSIEEPVDLMKALGHLEGQKKFMGEPIKDGLIFPRDFSGPKLLSDEEIAKIPPTPRAE